MGGPGGKLKGEPAVNYRHEGHTGDRINARHVGKERADQIFGRFRARKEGKSKTGQETSKALRLFDINRLGSNIDRVDLLLRFAPGGGGEGGAVFWPQIRAPTTRDTKFPGMHERIFFTRCRMLQILGSVRLSHILLFVENLLEFQ